MERYKCFSINLATTEKILENKAFLQETLSAV